MENHRWTPTRSTRDTGIDTLPDSPSDPEEQICYLVSYLSCLSDRQPTVGVTMSTESNEPESSTEKRKSSLSFSRRATLGLLGGLGLGTSEPLNYFQSPPLRLRRDLDVDGYDILNVGSLMMSGSQPILDFSGDNLSIDENGVLNASRITGTESPWDDIDGDNLLELPDGDGIDVETVRGDVLQTAGRLETYSSEEMQIVVDNQPVLSIRSTLPSYSPNYLSGHIGNSISSGVNGGMVIGGGFDDGTFVLPNTVTADRGTVLGGRGNTVSGENSTILGGNQNEISGNGSVVCAGTQNVITANLCTIGGGRFHDAVGVLSTIGGGNGNRTSGQWSTVAGGASNHASNFASTICGGGGNDTRGEYAFVGGGNDNWADGNYSTTSGGQDNRATGNGSTVPGGIQNEAVGNTSFAAGQHSKANHDGAFIWADSSREVDFPSVVDNELAARVTGGVRFVSGTDSNGVPTAGVQLSSGEGTWSSLSDAASKTDVSPVDSQEVLDRVSELSITTWSYKSNKDGVKHMGPMAQDLYAAFGLGADDKHISTVDADGVALAAIQALNEKLQKDNEDLRKGYSELESRLESLEEALLGRAS